jgi:hypothetical protein
MSGTFANDIDGAGGQQRNARLGRKRHVFDVKLVELELLLCGVGDLEADVDRVALHLAVGAEIGERYRRVAMADGEGLGLGDAPHDGTILGERTALQGGN